MRKLSRSKIELFLDCPRCFWLDINKGNKRPPPAPYTINSAIDSFLKNEFDEYRKQKIPHPIMTRYHLNAIPYASEHIDSWRHNFTGIQHQHKPTDFLVFGAVDDVWINSEGELIVVDYKSTGSNNYTIYDSYRRQMEIYQWLLRMNGYKVSHTGYFLFAKVDKQKGFSQGTLSFDLTLEPQKGDASWIEETLLFARKTLQNPIPQHKETCQYCAFAKLQNDSLFV